MLPFLLGEHDVIYSPEKAVARLKRVAPSVTAEIVPDAGHAVTVVEAEVVNRRILAFLRVLNRPLRERPRLTKLLLTGNSVDCWSADTRGS